MRFRRGDMVVPPFTKQYLHDKVVEWIAISGLAHDINTADSELFWEALQSESYFLSAYMITPEIGEMHQQAEQEVERLCPAQQRSYTSIVTPGLIPQVAICV